VVERHSKPHFGSVIDFKVLPPAGKKKNAIGATAPRLGTWFKLATEQHHVIKWQLQKNRIFYDQFH